MKPLKHQAAVISDNPAPYEARVVLEPDQHGMRAVLYEGNMETAERVMTAWNCQLGIETKDMRHPIGGRYR